MRQADIDDRRVEPLHDAGADDRRGREPAMRHRRRLRALAPHRRELWMAGPVMTVFIQPTATADAYSLRRAPERKAGTSGSEKLEMSKEPGGSSRLACISLGCITPFGF